MIKMRVTQMVALSNFNTHIREFFITTTSIMIEQMFWEYLHLGELIDKRRYKTFTAIIK